MAEKDPAARKAEAEAAAAELDLKLKRVELRDKKNRAKHDRYLRRAQRASDAYEEALDHFNYGVVRFLGAVTPRSTERARQELRRLVALRPGEPVRVEFNSPGGDVYSGLDLFDEIRRVSAAVAARQADDDDRPPVTTVVTGAACSMAGLLVQAGDWRVIGEHSYLHLHSAATITWGKTEELQDDVAQSDVLTQHMARIYARRATEAGRPIRPKEVRKLFARRELWLSARKALRLGFVDEIA